MISTVTTTTVTTVTTVTLGGSLALVGILVLLALLAQKEITSCVVSPRAQRLGRALMMGIVPLAVAFVLVVANKLSEVLR
jgi:putative effector of murein hydrolase LrgA (UPF0299 family)